MKKFFIIIIILMFMLSAYSFNAISKRFVGTISDYKIINSNMDWVVTSNGTEYIIEHTDDLFIGDSVFEYWVNYNKRYFGTQSCSQFINIIDRK